MASMQNGPCAGKSGRERRQCQKDAWSGSHGNDGGSDTLTAKAEERENRQECSQLSHDIKQLENRIDKLPACREQDRLVRDAERICTRRSRGLIDLEKTIGCETAEARANGTLPSPEDLLRGGNPKERCEEAKKPIETELAVLNQAAANLNCGFFKRR